MSSVENRVVKMSFDNASFEKNVNGTLGTLDKLKKALSFSDSKKNLDDLSKAGKDFKMDGMSSSIEGISAKFLALSTIGITALANITNKAIDAGLRIAKSLTLDPVIAGLQEYELNMESIQTILANTSSKGETLQTVNAALDELNTYADKTIYNFAQMTKNIGTFTAAGVDLDTSVRSIKGISNLAAVSGSSAQQASTAMYQLSQALASGTVKLMDWNSVVNAGMGGEVFQKALFETGKAMGTIADVPLTMSFDEWKASGNSFRESLENGWITAEVLTTTLEGFTGELDDAALAAKGYSAEQIAAIQAMAKTATAAATEIKTGTQLVQVVQEAIGTGWATTFRTIIGDFEQAKSLFTFFGNAITGVIGRMSDARNKLFEGWANEGGRFAVLEGLIRILRFILDIIAPIREAFREVFPPVTVKNLVDASNAFAEFSRKLKIGEGTAGSIKTVFTAFFTVLKVGVTVIGGVLKIFFKLIGLILKLATNLDFVVVAIAKAVLWFNNFVKSGELAQKFFSALGKAIELVGKAMDFLVPKIQELFGRIGTLMQPALDKIQEFKDAFLNIFSAGVAGAGGAVQSLDIMQRFSDAIDTVKGQIEDAGGVWDWLSERIRSFGDTVKQTLSNIQFDSVGAFFGSLGASIALAMGDVARFFVNFASTVSEAFKNIFSGGAAAGGAVGGAVGGAFKGITDFFLKIGELVIAAGVGISEFFKNFVSAITDAFQSENFAPAVAALGVGFLGAITALLTKFSKDGLNINFIPKALIESITKTFEQLTGTLKSMQTNLKADTLQKIAIALAVLVASIFVLTLLDPGRVAAGLAATAVGLGELVAVMKILDSLESNPAKTAAIGASIQAMSLAMLTLAVALKIMGSLSWDEIGRGLTVMTAGLAGLGAAAYFIGKSEASIVKAAFGLILLSGSILVLSLALIPMAKMSWQELAQGMAGVAAALILFGVFTNVVDSEDMAKLGGGMALFAISLGGIAKVVQVFSRMPTEELVKGFIALGVALAGIVIFIEKVKNEDLVRAGLGLLLLSASIAVIGLTLKVLAGLDIVNLAVALTSLVLVIATLVIAVTALNTLEAGVLGLIAAAGAIALLAYSLKLVGELGPLKILIGLVGIAAGLALIAGAAILLVPALPAMIALGIALAAVAAGFALFGVAALLFGAGVFLIAVAFDKLGDASKKNIGRVIDTINALLTALPGFAQKFAAAILEFVKSLVSGTGELIDIFGDILIKIIDKIIEITPKIGEALGGLISEGIKILKTKVPELIEAGLTIILALLTGIRDRISEFGKLAVEIISLLVQSIATNIYLIVSAAVNLMTAFVKGIADNIGKVIGVVGDLITAFITAVGNLATDIANAGATALVHFIEGITRDVAKITNAIGFLMLTIIYQMSTWATALADAGTDAIVSFLDSFSENISEIADAVGDFFANIITEMGKQGGKLVDAAIDAAIEFLDGLVDRTIKFVDKAGAFILKFLTGLDQAIVKYEDPIIRRGKKIVGHIIEGIVRGLGLDSAWRRIRDALSALLDKMPSWMEKVLEIFSPSRVFARIAANIPLGIAQGIDKNQRPVGRSIDALGSYTVDAWRTAMQQAAFELKGLDEFNPTITPVLDLTNVKAQAKDISSLTGTNPIRVTASTNAANQISAATNAPTSSDLDSASVGPTQVVFTQTINAPKALTTSEIYRNTRSQIELAKEELAIP